MSIAINRLLNDFQQCLAELAVVSGGSYLPPAGVIETMREAAGRVDGLDSAQLIAQSSAASGARRNKGDGFGFVLDMLSSGPGMQLAGGGMEALLRRFQHDHEEDQVASQEFADGAQACGRALDDIRDSSEIGLSEILGSAIPIVQLVTRLVRLHPIMRLTGMVGTLASMVIEPAVAIFMRTVGDRDDAICGCYEEFLRRCQQLCDKELVDPPAIAPDASGDGPGCGDKLVECPAGVEKPEGGPTPANESAQSQPQPQPQPQRQSQAQAKFADTSSQTTPVAEKPDFTKPVAEKLVAEPCPPGEINEPGTPQKAMPESPLAETPLPEEPLPEPLLAEESSLPEPELPDMTPRTQMASSVELGYDVAKSCVGQIARAGLGMAMVGAQLVQETAAECLEQLNCQPPQPEPAPQPVEPECPPEPQPAPEPEPDCPPEEKPVPEPQPEPEPDCSPEEKTVPEPTPEPVEKPAPEPEPAPEPAPEPEPAPVPEDEVIEKPMPEHSVDKKQFHSGPAQLAPEPAPEPVQSAQPEAPHPEAPQPQPDPQPEPAPAKPEQPASPDQDGGENPTHEAEAGVAADPEKTSGNTHRMGQW